ncbi:hypothetical protein H4F99_00890 [Lysobacter sp. SG-8]|uniref:Uncharacterized protein n=1 Tax=Marilutibacter penaei TaxID=2759900 RepID=A0A7W3U151_9GAMM|nr:hypothetical protein [Lysobacter penaei]MBB1087038.1 hypothetical protein [Lysobacter penaei]
MNLHDVMAVVNTEAAATLALSKGGWEGWVQCELWRHLTVVKGEPAEREYPYPRPYQRQRCDLVARGDDGRPLWTEIKAYGIFREGDADRFLDGIGVDLMKLENRPRGTRALSLVVVPKAIEESFLWALRQRKWLGFSVTNGTVVSVFHMTF